MWDACAVLLFNRLYTAKGLVAVLVSGAFQCLALSTMQPHVLAGINGISVVLALTVNSPTAKALSPIQKAAVVFMIVAAAIGLSGIQDHGESNHSTFVATIIVLCVSAAIVATKPIYAAFAHGIDSVRQSKLKYAIPVADALIACAATTCVAFLGSSTNLWTLIALLLIGVAGVGTSRFSLGVNTIKDHVAISYSLWSLGLIGVDMVGHYDCNPRLVAIQFFFVSLSLAILLAAT